MWPFTLDLQIKAMRAMCLPELNEMYQKIAVKCQQNDPQKSEQIERLKIFKNMLERMITFLQVPKNDVLLGYKDKLGSYEKQIISVLSSNRPKKPVSSQMQGQQHLQPPGGQLHSMQQQQQQSQPQSQLPQLQQPDNHMNPQMQSNNLPTYHKFL
ncbi:hypothetical protein NE237_009869 [Protea cynaroides]|uniref:Uncharacterized protein n=1 Tax=Protea cynaroides TaxID=273540 RepID=A0A9Q0KZE2_9MAGN|nr:hypothetical protein NE237_009869 [Protea cynaroides]